MNLKSHGLKDLLVISQTTFSVEKFEKIAEKIKESIDIAEEKSINIILKNTICNATKQRQEETTEISKTVDMMIIIGGKHSSNTLKLFEISKDK